MNRKIMAILLIVCMFTSILPVFGISAEDSSGYYQLVATARMDYGSYGLTAETLYSSITNLNYGTGWSDVWTAFSKVDGYGMFKATVL